MKNEQHIKEMIEVFRDDFNMHTEDVSHLTQSEHDKALYEYVIKRMSDNWEIDRNYSDSLQDKIDELNNVSYE